MLDQTSVCDQGHHTCHHVPYCVDYETHWSRWVAVVSGPSPFCSALPVRMVVCYATQVLDRNSIRVAELAKPKRYQVVGVAVESTFIFILLNK